MASQYYAPAPLPYQPIQSPNTTNPIGFNNTNDPRKIAGNQRQLVQGQGDALLANDQSLANQYLQQSGGTQAYLNPIENTLATGGGGYNPEETAAINLSPEEKQNLITSAGIDAGAGTAATVGAADRAAAASGGNPMAMATYRARAARDMASNSADAMTKARVAAKQQEAQGATTTGNARLAQQGQGLGYYAGLQGQQNQTGLSEQGLAQGAFGTTTSGTGAAADIGLKASQTPSTLDKIIGAGAGALSGFLSDGTPGYLDGEEAVVGESGPEAIIHMADGTSPGSGEVAEEGTSLPPMTPATDGDAANAISPWRQRAGQFLNNYLRSSQHQAVGAPTGGARPWSPVDTYSSLGNAIGAGVSHIAPFLADGGELTTPGGGSSAPIITRPTRVRLDKGDQVVPLSFRPKAKLRPSAALGAI